MISLLQLRRRRPHPLPRRPLSSHHRLQSPPKSHPHPHPKVSLSYTFDAHRDAIMRAHECLRVSVSVGYLFCDVQPRYFFELSKKATRERVCLQDNVWPHFQVGVASLRYHELSAEWTRNLGTGHGRLGLDPPPPLLPSSPPPLLPSSPPLLSSSPPPLLPFSPSPLLPSSPLLLPSSPPPLLPSSPPPLLPSSPPPLLPSSSPPLLSSSPPSLLPSCPPLLAFSPPPLLRSCPPSLLPPPPLPAQYSMLFLKAFTRYRHLSLWSYLYGWFHSSIRSRCWWVVASVVADLWSLPTGSSRQLTVLAVQGKRWSFHPQQSCPPTGGRSLVDRVRCVLGRMDIVNLVKIGGTAKMIKVVLWSKSTTTGMVII